MTESAGLDESTIGTAEPAEDLDALLAEADRLWAEAEAIMAEEGDYDDDEPFVQPAGMPADFGTQFDAQPAAPDPAVGPFDGFDDTEETP